MIIKKSYVQMLNFKIEKSNFYFICIKKSFKSTFFLSHI